MRRAGDDDDNGGVNSHSSTRERFTDPAVSLYDLAEDPVYVVCPVCQGRAEVAPWLDGEPRTGYSAWWPRRLVCPSCGHARTWPGKARNASSCWGAPVDPYFRQPLWLRAGCCGGHTLWAFNEHHLDILEGYIGARLRERGGDGGMTMVARLPAWLKSARNRTEVLRCIGRLRASLPQ